MILLVKEGVLLLASYFQCCRSEMFILDPVSGLFSIPDHGSLIPRHGSKTKKSREKCKCVYLLPFVAFCCFFSKFKINFFEQVQKLIWVNLTKNLIIFNKKIMTKLSQIWAGSWIQKKNWSRIQGTKSTRSKIRCADWQHWLFSHFVLCFNFLCLIWVYISRIYL